ncbi:uncharacterized protein BDV17DRAFT_264181 [Aspergillus undulatus]|uniref:uncharacterized protein n=1 Tax=Aspergillus undulatus TaxID=1810928 RepID=UPI003CCD3288
MTKCLYSARLLCLRRRSSLHPSLAAVPSSPAVFRTGWRLQWNNQYSIGARRRGLDSEFLKRLGRLGTPPRLVPEWQGKKVKPWISLLEELLPPSSKDTATHPNQKASPGITRESFASVVDLALQISLARTELNRDLLAHLGFKLNDWSKVHNILNRLLDAVEALEEAFPHQRGAIDDWARSSQLSLDQLTDQDLNSPPQPPRNMRATGSTRLDASTYRPYSRDYHMLVMGEVWKSLGAIVLYAADTSPAKSKLAMSVVYRILARLHHSGLVSERVYQYATPGSQQAIFRPPGMHLLYSHIMDNLSDAAWLVYEAESAAKAAAAGQDAPFLPAKIGIKELGHEIWLEFILWCCVEHGHINEGIWLANLLKGRKGWKFQSWEPLLRNEEALRNTKLNREISTWPSPDSASGAPEPLKRTEAPCIFHGIGRRTISAEVVAALLGNLPNLVYLGMSSREGVGGVSVAELFRQFDNLKFAIELPSPPSDSKYLPTTRAINWYTIRVLETNGLNPEADPQTFDELLKLTPHVVPPWSSSIYSVEEEVLAEVKPSQLYDDTAAFTGLMEYNLKNHSVQRFCGSALNLFAMLQDVIDTCKLRRVDEFFSSQAQGGCATQPSEAFDSSVLVPLKSSIPQLSNVTLAHLIDLITTSRAFAFGDWLLASDDIDGSTVPASAYSDQALAPSLLRFAAATKNDTLGELVMRSLKPPVTLNTLRALLNYHIVMNQWDRVIPILTYIRDNRIKSWSHSNIAAIAAQIIRLDHTLLLLQSLDSSNPNIPDIGSKLAEAKDVLYRILRGDFHENPWRKRTNPRFQPHTVVSFTRLFRHLPSTSLHEIAETISWETKHVPMHRLPYIPSPPFHLILAATVDTYGTFAARNLYKRFCVSYSSPELSRLVPGGLTRFLQKAERDFEKGDPNFDAQYFYHLQKKMVFPNPNTLRILTQAAVREYQALIAEAETETQPEFGSHDLDSETSTGGFNDEPPTQHSVSDTDVDPDTEADPVPIPTSPPLSHVERLAEAQRTLVFCITRFKIFRMSDTEIAREVGEEFYSQYLIFNEERRERDRRAKSELRRKWQNREDLKKRLQEIETTTAAEVKNDQANAPLVTRKERRKMWQKKQDLRVKLRRSEKSRNDVKLNVLLDMTTKRKREQEPRIRSERKAIGRQNAIARREKVGMTADEISQEFETKNKLKKLQKLERRGKLVDEQSPELQHLEETLAANRARLKNGYKA